MKHLKQGRRLSRSVSHRKALLSALSIALIKHKRIRTTTAKAKETRRIIEPLITRARDAYLREKSGDPVDVHARREIAKFIRDKDAVKILFADIAEKVGKRPGGYTRVLKLGHRLGDGAEMAVIELVDYNEAQDDKKRQNRAARSKEAAARRKVTAEKKTKEAAVETEEAVAETEAAAAETEAAAAETEAAAAETEAAAEVEEISTDVEAQATGTDTPDVDENAKSADPAEEADAEATEKKK